MESDHCLSYDQLIPLADTESKVNSHVTWSNMVDLMWTPGFYPHSSSASFEFIRFSSTKENVYGETKLPCWRKGTKLSWILVFKELEKRLPVGHKTQQSTVLMTANWPSPYSPFSPLVMMMSQLACVACYLHYETSWFSCLFVLTSHYCRVPSAKTTDKRDPRRGGLGAGERANPPPRF